MKVTQLRGTMEVSEPSIVFLGVTGLFGFVGWLVRRQFTEVENLDSRVTVLETKMNVLGDIKESLNHVKTDVEVIKERVPKVEHTKNIKED